jgi:hypothetical protein
MVSREDELQDIIRNTIEYHEARALLAEKATLHAEIARINAELRQFQKLSAFAVELAKIDAQDAFLNAIDGFPPLSAKIGRDGPKDNAPVLPRDELPAEHLDARLAQFLAEVDRKVDWKKVDALVAPAYYNGTWPAPRPNVSSMIRLYFLQEWCSMPDKTISRRIQHCPATSAFVGIDRQTPPPSPATLLRFKCLLAQSGLAYEISQIVMDGLEFKDAPVPQGIRQ